MFSVCRHRTVSGLVSPRDLTDNVMEESFKMKQCSVFGGLSLAPVVALSMTTVKSIEQMIKSSMIICSLFFFFLMT